MNFEEFLHHYSLNAPQIMWFLGAGASRSAGMPSATDIIWDLKRRYYCTKENREISDNELSNNAVKYKIQTYLEANGCPPMWSEGEYAHYFKLVFGDHAPAHQKYLEEKLSPEAISINSGHRILSALLAMGKARLVFTTNFDSVLEKAFAFMEGSDLHAFSLDGSYAALNALNNENFPIYAKMHGDFRYFEMKNLPEQLMTNDTEIEKCFVNACSRYGLVVSGYSGRDQNVMAAFNKAIDQSNAFPKGLFWTTSINGNVYSAVKELIQKARDKGINADIIETDTFDTLLVKIWKQLENKSQKYDDKIRRSIYAIPKVEKYSGVGNYPLIRMNAFPIIEMPQFCIAIETSSPLSVVEFKEKEKSAKSAAIMVREKAILAWGSWSEIHKIIPENEIKTTEQHNLAISLAQFQQNSLINALISRGIARALTKDKPLRLRKKHGKFYAVISSRHPKYSEIEPILKDALRKYDFQTKKEIQPESLAGKTPNSDGIFWMEAVEISLDFTDERFWIILRPEIWVEPDEQRRNVIDFLNGKKRERYNQTQNRLVEAWQKILFGSEKIVAVKVYDEETENNPLFKISTTTAYSLRSAQ